MEMKRLLLGAGLTAVLFGGVAAPLATANEATPDVAVCNSSDAASPASGAGEGLILAGATDDADGLSCSYTSSGAAAQYGIASASPWEITVTRGTTVVLTITNPGVAAGGAPVANGDIDPAPGDVVTLTAQSACDPSGQGCGANIQGAIGVQG